MWFRAGLAWLLFAPAAAGAQSFDASCGAARFQVTAENRGHPLDNRYQLDGQLGEGGVRRPLYTSEVGGWFYAECTAAADGRPLLLFQAFCGGSTCVEDKYGIVDPQTLQLLLVPELENKGNAKAAVAILKTGRVPHLPESKTAFCCEVKSR